ncbi:DUF2490 domain-containing protein [Anditalea andensis]|uniref:DUF2490 domain-containing protein n=1 Tax=Anditalea andensis TaxID=1048983 RepID=A0A074L3U9_9BACT|nr:DUF2490 domain-containing protein [Anditalea andensis]KEO75879.1 hypothetical protein EL17_22945 [Anditalea andensis]
MKHIKFLGLAMALALYSLPTFSQNIVNNEIGGWIMVFNRIRFHDKWSMHNEVQDRFYDVAGRGEQLLIRTGFNYHYSDKLWLTAGYGYIENYPTTDAGGRKVVEHRIWQQGLYFHALGRVALEHRGRLEQRFVGDRYRNRIRYRLLATLPLNKVRMQPKTVFLAAYNEIFFHFEDQPYDRNRLYGAIGYQFTTSTHLQAGYMAQNFANVTKGYLQLMLTSNLYLLGK